MGGKGGGEAPDLMLPQPQSDNSELYMAMMEQQSEQNQQMMQMMAQMMLSGQGDDQPPVVVMPGSSDQGGGASPYQSIDFSGVRDRLNEQASQNLSDEASNRTGRTRTIISEPRLDKSAPMTTGDKAQMVEAKSLLSSDDEDQDTTDNQ